MRMLRSNSMKRQLVCRWSKVKFERSLRIISLGGSGEVGKNMLAFHYDDTIIVVDAGVAFPTEEHSRRRSDHPGHLLSIERREMVKAICLTHGHEDHIGAPYPMY